MIEMINGHLSSSFSYRKLSIVSPLSLIISFKYPDQGSLPILGGKGKRYSLKDYKRPNARCWKANVKKMDFQKMLSSPHRKNKNEQEQNKENEKGTKRSEKMRDEWKDNEKWSFMKWSLVWSPWNTVWAYLSFLSEPRTQAYITYLKSPFWLNVDTWTEEFSSLRNFYFL